MKKVKCFYRDNLFFFSKRLLEATKNETLVRSQDLFTVVRYVSYNPLGQSMAWDWATLNWDYLVNRLVQWWHTASVRVG